jgi:hypothetical protein
MRVVGNIVDWSASSLHFQVFSRRIPRIPVAVFQPSVLLETVEQLLALFHIQPSFGEQRRRSFEARYAGEQLS